MRRLRRLCAVITLCALLACTAFAGKMPFPMSSPSAVSSEGMPTPNPTSAGGQIETMPGALVEKS